MTTLCEMFCPDNLRQAMADLEERKQLEAFENTPTVASSEEDEEEEEEEEEDWNNISPVGFEHPTRYLPI